MFFVQVPGLQGTLEQSLARPSSPIAGKGVNQGPGAERDKLKEREKEKTKEMREREKVEKRLTEVMLVYLP